MGALQLQPITFAEAAEFVRLHHRHHAPPPICQYSIAVNDGEQVVGVVMVARPVSRHCEDGYTLEVARCCVLADLPGPAGHANSAASMLYAAAWRAARALGYRRLITYTLATEPGTSLKAAGWRVLYQTRGNPQWGNRRGRPRVEYAGPKGPKTLWEAT